MSLTAKAIKLHSAHVLNEGRRVASNFLASPLLMMPQKIREIILAYIVGGQTVHVKFVPHEEVIQLEDLSPVPISAPGVFRHTTCVAKETEWDAYAQSARTYVL